MATYTLTPLPRLGITPEAGMLINTYLSGTSTPTATYADTIGTSLPNPIVANGLGLFPAIYLLFGTNYKYVCTTSAGVLLWTQDALSSVPSSSSAVDVPGTAGENIADRAPAYLSVGSGGKSAGQWYNADYSNAYSSSTPSIGFATSAITAGSIGGFRMQGHLSGFTGLSVGDYYVGSSGTITATMPANARLIGCADSTTSLIIYADPPSSNSLDFCQLQVFG